MFVKALVTLAICSQLLACRPPDTPTPSPREQAQTDMRSASLAAQEVFAKRCESAGLKVYEPLEKPAGFQMLTLRQRINTTDKYSYDPSGDLTEGEGYVETLLIGRDERGDLNAKRAVAAGYSFVDVVDAETGQRTRYTATYDPAGLAEYQVHKAPVANGHQLPRYGIRVIDLSTTKERDLWIAGSTIQLVELSSNKVVAEFVRFLRDAQMGAGAPLRQPWFFARHTACPAFPLKTNGLPTASATTRKFLDKVFSEEVRLIVAQEVQRRRSDAAKPAE